MLFRFMLIITLFMAGSTYAKGCPSAEALGKTLTDLGEKIVATGVVADGKSGLTIWASKTGNFSVVILNTDGTACLTLFGGDFTRTPPGIPG